MRFTNLIVVTDGFLITGFNQRLFFSLCSSAVKKKFYTLPSLLLHVRQSLLSIGLVRLASASAQSCCIHVATCICQPTSSRRKLKKTSLIKQRQSELDQEPQEPRGIICTALWSSIIYFYIQYIVFFQSLDTKSETFPAYCKYIFDTRG